MLRKGAFWDLNPPDQQRKWKTPNPKNWFGLEIRFIHPFRQSRWIQRRAIFFKWRRYRQKTRCDGGSRQTKSTEVHYNSRYTTDLHELDAGWQTHKCLGSGLCCPEKFRKFLTMVEPERKNGGISSILPTRISFPANQWYRRKCTLRSSQPTRYQEAQMGNPNPYKCCDSGNSFRPSYPT